MQREIPESSHNYLVAIVIPTKGSRSEYLKRCVASVRLASVHPVHIVIVGPESSELSSLCMALSLENFVIDKGKGLAAAINSGVRSLPPSIKYLNWIGDDDLLRSNSIDVAIDLLEKNPQSTFVFGACDYINADDEVLFTNKSGKWAVPLMQIGPQLVPQPGALIRRRSFDEIGGLNTDLKWAFDLDMFLRLSDLGKPKYVPETLSAFRWHKDSLTVGNRKGSVLEASSVRRQHLPRYLRTLSVVWEPIIRKVILFAGSRVSRRYGM